MQIKSNKQTKTNPKFKKQIFEVQLYTQPPNFGKQNIKQVLNF